MGRSKQGRPATRPKNPLDRTRPLWERQLKESDPAWQAFVVYREMGLDRTLRTACEKIGKSSQLLGDWSSRWSWLERCRAYDAEIDRQRVDAAKLKARAEVEAMRERHLSIAADFQRLGQVEFRRHMRKLKADVEKPSFDSKPEIAIDQIRGVIGDGIKLERINRGEPDAINETRGTVDVTVRSYADLISKALARKAKAGGEG